MRAQAGEYPDTHSFIHSLALRACHSADKLQALDNHAGDVVSRAARFGRLNDGGDFFPLFVAEYLTKLCCARAAKALWPTRREQEIG